MSKKIKVVHKFEDGRSIIEVATKLGKKYTFVKDNDLYPLNDLDGNMSGIQFFDDYEVSDDGDVIIKLFKNPNEWLRVLKEFDLSDAQAVYTEVPGGPFNIGPYAKQYFDYKAPTKKVDDIVPSRLKYSYGVVNSEGVLTVFPQFDDMYFVGEGACAAGNLFCCGDCRYGYLDCTTGKAFTPMAFDEAHPFSEERAIVKYKRQYGFIDRCKIMTDANDNDQYAKGLAPTFHRVTPFQDGRATVTIGMGSIYGRAPKFFVDKNGEYISCVTRKHQYVKKINNNNNKSE